LWKNAEMLIASRCPSIPFLQACCMDLRSSFCFSHSAFHIICRTPRFLSAVISLGQVGRLASIQ
jgi:hypothetical protein